MRGKLGASIENKILVPFVCISLITVLCFCFILYRTEYSVKIRTETVNAQALVQYINADIDAGGYWTNPWDLVEKYAATYQGDSLFLYTARDEPLFSRRELGDAELVLADSQDNRLGWRVLYSLDRNALRLEFIEEQRYMILAAVAMLLVIVQASVVIAYNISAPIRQLSKMCTLVSRNPGGSEDLAVEYTGRRDEAGQLAAAFQSMMENVRSYTQALNRIKTLNESIVANLPLGVAVYDLDGRVIFQNLRADGMLRQAGADKSAPGPAYASAGRSDLFSARPRGAHPWGRTPKIGPDSLPRSMYQTSVSSSATSVFCPDPENTVKLDVSAIFLAADGSRSPCCASNCTIPSEKSKYLFAAVKCAIFTKITFSLHHAGNPVLF